LADAGLAPECHADAAALLVGGAGQLRQPGEGVLVDGRHALVGERFVDAVTEERVEGAQPFAEEVERRPGGGDGGKAVHGGFLKVAGGLAPDGIRSSYPARLVNSTAKRPQQEAAGPVRPIFLARPLPADRARVSRPAPEIAGGRTACPGQREP